MTKWRKMNSAPRDGTIILVGLWVIQNQRTDPYYWKQYVAFYNAEKSTAYAQGFDGMPEELPWSWDDFDAWTVIPKPPHWGKE